MVGTTIKAMKRIAEIKHDREARHIERRLRGKKKERTLQAIKELRQFRDVIRPPTATRPSLIDIKASQRVKKLQLEREQKQKKESEKLSLPSPVQKS